jgi:hypothetical protein
MMGEDESLMLRSNELADRLKRCGDGQLPLEDFEDWFALNSWNVHLQQNKNLTDAVFRVEYLFSSLNDGRLKVPEVRREFAALAAAVKTLPAEPGARAPFAFQPNPPSPYSIAKSQQFIADDESNWLPVLAFGSLDAGISLSFGG